MHAPLNQQYLYVSAPVFGMKNLHGMNLVCINLTINCTYNYTETCCGSVCLKGPLNENGQSERLLVVANLSSDDRIIIKYQLTVLDNRTDVTYNPKLRIHLASIGEICTIPSRCEIINYTLPNKEKEGNKLNFTFDITANIMLEKSFITCGVTYLLGDGMESKCFTESAALIKFQDYDPCNSTTQPTTLPTTPPITPPTTSPITNSSTAPPTSTGEPPPPPTSTTIGPPLPSTTHTTTTKRFSVTDTRSGTDYIEKGIFFPTVAVLFAVAVILLVGNIVQLIIIVKRKKIVSHSESDNVSGDGSQTFENSMTKERE